MAICDGKSTNAGKNKGKGGVNLKLGALSCLKIKMFRFFNILKRLIFCYYYLFSQGIHQGYSTKLPSVFATSSLGLV